MAESVSAGSGVGVLDKAVRLLDLLAAGSARSSAELAEAAGISRPTTYRLLSALEEHGLAARTETGTWGLGTRLRAWANGTNGEHALVSAGLGAVARLRDRTGESAQLYLRRGEERICVAAAEPGSGLLDTVPVGAVLPLQLGSAGKVLLAYDPDYRGRRPARAELSAIRHAGWAASSEERETGVASVSVPVLDGDRILGALSISGPAQRFDQVATRRFVPELLEAARRLAEDALGQPL